MNQELIRFGSYILLDKIAVGGMAEIWRARTVGGIGGFERTVALKCILAPYTENEEFKAMFVEEARIASTLNHSNIVRITNFGSIDDKYYHEMEFVDGKSLRQIVKKARDLGVDLPIDCVSYIIGEVCKGLNYAHMKHDPVTNQHLRIIHRDVSPQNIMISYSGEVKIIDWGIAKAVSNMDQTRAGVLKGKFGYMSPEQTAGIPLDLRSDIFSTGIVFYESLCGRRLFVAENEIATLKKIQDCDIISPSHINGNIDANLEKIVLKSLARDREERYQTCQQLYNDINTYMNTNYPSFSFDKLASFVKQIFSQEIVEDREKVKNFESSISSLSLNTSDNIISKDDNTRLSSYNQASFNSFSSKSSSNSNIQASLSSSFEDKTRIASKQDRNNYNPDFEEVNEPKTTYIENKESNSKISQTSFETKEIKFNETTNKKNRTKLYKLIFIILILIPLSFYINKFIKKNKAVLNFKPNTQESILNKKISDEIINKQEYAVLFLNSDPEGARVVINDKFYGYTPIELKDLLKDTRYKLDLFLEGYEEFSRNIILRKAESKSSITLQKLETKSSSNHAVLNINVDIPTYIYINNVLVSKLTNVKNYKVKPGKHTVRFINTRTNLDYTVDIEVKAGEVLNRTYNLR